MGSQPPRGRRGDLLLGSRREHFTATEVDDSKKEPILREYLRRWKWEVGRFFGGVGPDSPPEDMARIAPDHPVFLISSSVQSGGDRSS